MSGDLPRWAQTLATFDTETTGIDTSNDRVVSSTLAVLGAGGEVLERHDWLLDPGVEIPDEASRLHGITTEAARARGLPAAEGIAGILEGLRSVLDRRLPLVVYNAPFDLSLMRAEARRHELEWLGAPFPIIDPLVIDKQVDRYRKGKRTLEAMAPHYGVTLEGAHDAGHDAIAAGRVAQALARTYAAKLPHDVMELHKREVEWAKVQAAGFQDFMRRTKDPAFVAEGGWPLY